MKHTIRSSQDLGMIVRAVRKSAGIRQDDMAAVAQLSKQFAADVEHGKPTAQIGRVLRLLDSLGIEITVGIPESAEPRLRQYRLRWNQNTLPQGQASGAAYSKRVTYSDHSDASDADE